MTAVQVAQIALISAAIGSAVTYTTTIRVSALCHQSRQDKDALRKFLAPAPPPLKGNGPVID